MLLAFSALTFIFATCDDELDANLPASIQTYVSANYPGSTVDEAEEETDCTGATVYDVELENETEGNTDEADIELSFDANGSFLYSETETATTALPATVTDAVTANYASFTIKEASVLTLADGSTQYEVEVKKGLDKREVRITNEGIVVCEMAD